MEISAYDVHHIVSKYLNLRQHVFVISDWLVFFCSFLCCQCGEYFAQDMPVDGLSEVSSVIYQITPQKLEISTVQANEELFKPLHLGEEAAESALKCTEIWSIVDKPRELDGKVVQDNNFETLLTLTDSLSEEILSPAANRSNDYPTVHSHKNPQQHQVSEA